MTLVPQRRLLAALVGGALLIVLILVNIGFVVFFIVYYAVLIGIVLPDVRRLPRPAGFMASRVLPEPFSLGEPQAVQVLIAHPNGAGLHAEVADHVPAGLRPDRRVVDGTFDGE